MGTQALIGAGLAGSTAAASAAIALAPLAVMEQDDEALRKRFEATCGLTCRRAKPAFEAFLTGRRAELMRQRDAATLKPR